MGQIPIKYLRFSLLVVSVFIFAGSARASENKNTSVSVQTSNKVDISSSTPVRVEQSQQLSDLSKTTAASLPTQNNSLANGTTTDAGTGGSLTSGQIGSEADLQPTDHANAKPVQALSDLQPPASPSKFTPAVDNQSKVQLPANIQSGTKRIGVKITSAQVASTGLLPGVSVATSQPANTNGQHHNQPLPMSQSAMLIASLSQLLLSANILQKMTVLSDGLPGLALLWSDFFGQTAAVGLSIILLASIGLYLTQLRRSGFWHGARSAGLTSGWQVLNFKRGLVGLLQPAKCQALFIYNNSCTVNNIGGQIR